MVDFRFSVTFHKKCVYSMLYNILYTLTKSNIKIDKLNLPTFYWLPKLHKNPYKSRFLSNSSHCSTTILSKYITSALTTIKDHVIKYSETAFSKELFLVHQKLF